MLPEIYIFFANQLFDLERKLTRLQNPGSLHRNVERMKNKLAESGIEIVDPTGESYNETRTDCEASIAGESSENLVITEVIKPILRLRQGAQTSILQKAIVIAESKS